VKRRDLLAAADVAPAAALGQAPGRRKDADLSHAHVKRLNRHPFKAGWWNFTDIGR
jgi:hypothetical protein